MLVVEPIEKIERVALGAVADVPGGVARSSSGTPVLRNSVPW